MAERAPFKHAEAEQSPGFLLWQVTVLWQQRLEEVFGRFGITQTQYAILASLRWFEERERPATQAALVAHAKLDKMTLSKAIRRLESDGLVKRSPSAADGRATEARLTAKGRGMTDRAIVAVEEADDQFFGALPAGERARYNEVMLGLIAAHAG